MKSCQSVRNISTRSLILSIFLIVIVLLVYGIYITEQPEFIIIKNYFHQKSDDIYQSELRNFLKKTDKPSDSPNLDDSLPQSTNHTDSIDNLRDSPRIISDDYSDSEAGKPDNQTIISVLGRPMEEPVTKVNYADNVYFTIKTTETNYKSRLSLLMMTWLQLVKHKVAIISDGSNDNDDLKEIRGAGFDVVVTDCSSEHKTYGLCCKSGEEYAAYYRAREKHQNKEGYQWFCHFDDDAYLNVPQLGQLLQKYDPHQPHYIGSKWRFTAPNAPIDFKAGTSSNLERLHYTIKQRTYRFSSGAFYCISSAIMTEAEKFLNGKQAFTKSCKLSRREDDCTIGFVIGIFLGHKFTSVDGFYDENFDMKNSTIQEALHFILIISLSTLPRCVMV
ncbi:beta-1,3-N-acetylglucosaminyltransferase radical fringe-like isoform X2 [Dysidea avara]|uniref:beta-1,3-N-acetylglucosaminyltransferase radical fringe-like isoform X2 n=1 Tax=Dysidea avara TaxID=196820 RepID=UPI00331B666B